MKVGFIGPGHMGAGMAMNLLNAGHDVTVYNRTRKKVEALLEHGARAASTIADACRGEAVFTMLADDAAVEFVTIESAASSIVLLLERCTVRASHARSCARWTAFRCGPGSQPTRRRGCWPAVCHSGR